MATTVVMIILALTLSNTVIPKAEAAVSCGQIVSSIAPCMYCNGIRNLVSIARTTPDRHAVCSCINSAAASSGFRYSNINRNLAAGLPKKCGINIPYQISPNTDCARVY